jgi:hypothetical protein
MLRVTKRLLPPALLALALCCLLLSPPANGAAARQVPQPVMNAAVFNDPADGPASGTPTDAQRAVFDQLIGLIDAVPAGERISFAMFEFQDGESGVPGEVVDSLLAAHHRAAIADELLRLRGENCWIDVVYADGGIEQEVLDVLSRTASNGQTIQLTPCPTFVPHSKVTMIDGFYDDDIQPRVYTGSANFTHLENSDDSQLRITGRATHDAYLSWFYELRTACQAQAQAS